MHYEKWSTILPFDLPMQNSLKENNKMDIVLAMHFMRKGIWVFLVELLMYVLLYVQVPNHMTL